MKGQGLRISVHHQHLHVPKHAFEGRGLSLSSNGLSLHSIGMSLRSHNLSFASLIDRALRSSISLSDLITKLEIYKARCKRPCGLISIIYRHVGGVFLGLQAFLDRRLCFHDSMLDRFWLIIRDYWCSGVGYSQYAYYWRPTGQSLGTRLGS